MKSARIQKPQKPSTKTKSDSDTTPSEEGTGIVDETTEQSDTCHNATKKRRKENNKENVVNILTPIAESAKPLSELSVIVATRTFATDGIKSDSNPSARWGHAWCMISESEAVLIGGQGEKHILCKDALWQLDLVGRKWSIPEIQAISTKPEARTGHSVVFDPMARSLCLYGGSKNKKWYSDVHMIDLDTWSWQCVQASGKAPTRAYHTCTLYGHEMWIFGGVFPRPDPQPDGCSNDIFVFSLYEEMWYMPLVMGTKPSPRSGHSATLFQNKIVVFGGWDAPVCYNDIFILDLSLVEWSKPVVKGTPPSPRSWHSSCALSGNCLFIHGGYNGNNALGDAFIFDLDSLTWYQVTIDQPVNARTGHVAICLPSRYETRDIDNVVLFGGGDNEGAFFADLIGLSIPSRSSSQKWPLEPPAATSDPS